MWVSKKTLYGGDVVMFLPNKIIKNNKLNYPQKPYARPSKEHMVLLYMV